jgi:hypothetical protein
MEHMNQADDVLSRYLVLYQFIDTETDPSFTLHIQLGPGCDSLINFELLQKKRLRKIKEFSFVWKKPLLSLTVEDEDTVFIHAIGQDGTVTVGGIWQVQWRNDEAYEGVNGYMFREVASSGIEMVKVETLLQEEEYALFEDAVAYANIFLEKQGSISVSTFIGGREIGVSAPERIHQVAPFPSDIRAVEHTWLLVFSGFRENTSRTLFFLLEVMYHFQDQEWQFAIRTLQEGDDDEIWSVEFSQ